MAVRTKGLRRKVKILQKKGLLTSRVNANRPTEYLLRQVARYEDVIEGRASVVKGKQSKEELAKIEKKYGTRVRVEKGKVIVKGTEGLPVTYNKRKGLNIKRGEKRITLSRRKLKKGERYVIYFYRGKHRPMDRRSWATFDDMQAAMQGYVSEGKFTNWEDYYEIESV